MKFKINTRDLIPKLDVLYKVVPPKATLPILRYIYFNLCDDRLEITATDLELRIKCSVIPEEIISIGSICVEASKITDIIKSLKDRVVSFEVDDKENMIVRASRSKYKIPTMPDEEFPSEPTVEGEQVSLPKELLIEGIMLASHCVGTDDLRPITKNVAVDMMPHATYVMSSDMIMRMSMFKTDPIIDERKIVLLSPKLASILPSVASDGDLYYAIKSNDKFVELRTESYSLLSTMTDGEYPDYKTVIPKEHDFHFTVNVHDLLEAIKRALIFANKESAMIFAEAKREGLLRIVSEDIDFNTSAEEEIPTSTETGGAFCVNGKKLIDHLSKMHCENAVISFSNKKPIIIKPLGDNVNQMMMLMQMAVLN